MQKFHLVLLIHSHQPVGNFDSVFEQTYQRSYLPFIECLVRHPGVHLGLHYSGALLEWFAQKHPEFLDVLRKLAAQGQVEMIGGGFYEPILISIPREDQMEQLRRMSHYLAQIFGIAPMGAWLAERVWEPHLPQILSSAGVRYTLVDDIHFLSAGFNLNQLHGDYLSDDAGHSVRVFPGLKALRYLLPFRPPEETLSFLKECAARNPGGLAAMGDDCEKFGAWPETYDHCYREGWVDRFFAALENASDWLSTTTPGEYIATHVPLGRADLPAASYTEMMEWALPTPARSELHDVAREFAARADVLRFLRGGHWRGFFTKYAESNLLHKKMLHVSAQLRRLAGQNLDQQDAGKLATARTHLLRAQCNDAYWHGVFGGLYAPHLRTEPWRSLVHAETLAHEISSRSSQEAQFETLDYDADGREEVYVTGKNFAALLKPSDGATVAALDFRSSGITLINSMARRAEAYHSRLLEMAKSGSAATGQVVSIHDQVRSKEPGLERFLRYDRWQRNAFRLLVFSAEKTFEDYRLLRLDEHCGLAAGNYVVNDAKSGHVKLSCESRLPPIASGAGSSSIVACTKNFSFAQQGSGYTVACDIELSFSGQHLHRTQIGIEIVLNFLAPDENDRYFLLSNGRRPLRWPGIAAAANLPNGRLKMVDEWQNVAATMEARERGDFWIAPIETVSESEEGFERVYQGSQIMAVWPVELVGDSVWRGGVTLAIDQVRTP